MRPGSLQTWHDLIQFLLKECDIDNVIAEMLGLCRVYTTLVCYESSGTANECCLLFEVKQLYCAHRCWPISPAECTVQFATWA